MEVPARLPSTPKRRLIEGGLLLGTRPVPTPDYPLSRPCRLAPLCQ